MALEHFDKAEEAKTKGVEVKSEITLSSILEDSKKSSLFGHMLSEGGEEDKQLAERLATHQLEEGDIKILEEKRAEAAERFEEVEKAKNFINKENISSLAQNNEKFMKIINLVGENKAMEIIKSELDSLAFKNPNRFREIFDSINNLNSFKGGEYKQLDEEITKIAKDHHIKDSSYAKLLAIEDEDERVNKIRDEIRKDYGFFRRKWGDLRGNKSKSMKDAIELAGKREDILEAKTKLKNNLDNIGLAISLSVDRDEVLRNTLANELTGKPMDSKEKSDLGFKQSREAVPTLENTKTEWEEYKKKNDWKKITSEPEQEAFKERFINSIVEKRTKNKTGFWEVLFGFLLERSKSELLEKLK